MVVRKVLGRLDDKQYSLKQIPDPQIRAMLEEQADEKEFQRRKQFYIPRRTRFGDIFEYLFKLYIIPLLSAIGKGNVEVYTNYGRKGFDVYVYLNHVGKWIIIELKNWHHYPTGVLNNNYFNRKPYVRINGKTIKIDEKDVLKRFLIVSCPMEVSYDIQLKLQNTNTILICGNECFEDKEYLTNDNKRFIIQVYLRLARTIMGTLYKNEDQNKILSQTVSYILHRLNVVYSSGNPLFCHTSSGLVLLLTTPKPLD